MHDELGNLTVNNAIVEINHDKKRLTLNLRVLITYCQEDVVKALTAELAKFDLQLTDLKWENPVHMPKDSPVIQNIMQVYCEVTGDHNVKPLAIGEGTYAKAMPNCVAFGTEFDIEELTMHVYNEYVKIDDLRKMLEIHTKSIPLLTKINK